jgi:hypothetical protein
MAGTLLQQRRLSGAAYCFVIAQPLWIGAAKPRLFSDGETIQVAAYRTLLQGAREVRAYQATPVKPCSRPPHLNQAPRNRLPGIYRANAKTSPNLLIMRR